MDVAILFQKIILDETRFILKPICPVTGEYDKNYNAFCTNFDKWLSDIYEDEDELECRFSFKTTIKELQKKFGKEKDDNKLLTEYFDLCSSYCYIGYYDKNDDLKIKKISFDEIENFDYIAGFNNEDKKEEINVLENSRLEKPSTVEKQNIKINYNLTSLRDKVSKTIIDQDDAVNDLTRAIVKNLNSKNPNHRSHIMIAGPTGTGKTKMVSIIAKELNLPYFEADSTQYTQAGYKGKDPNSLITGLITAAGNDIQKAQNGILIIDEIDKKISKSPENPGGEIVLESLPKILDRGIIEVDIGKGSAEAPILFDTSNLTVICMGAFEKLYEEKLKSNNKRIGFYESDLENSNDITITRQDIIDYGMPAEFLGRFKQIAYTKKLGKNSFVRILNESDESPIKEAIEFFKDQDKSIEFDDDFIEVVATKALETTTGARNLRTIVDEALEDVYDDVLTDSKVKKYVIRKNIFDNPKKYYTK
ncbi:MAG: AAA family ATPase [bacterium]|nr:AAA family ATPase [bacterium]